MFMAIQNHHNVNEDMKYTKLFWFNTNGLPDTDTDELEAAELRLYKEGIAPSSEDYR